MPEPGLCGSCVACRVVQTGRSTFYLCERSRTDPRYRRYPVIPVRSCAGFEPGAAAVAPGRDATGREGEAP
jgi:hypothetical protein